MDKESRDFDAPIPGESLTQEPKKYPWEQPPEITDPKDALNMHMERLSRPDVMDGTIAFLEAGVPLKDMVLGVLRVAVSEGYHTPDVSLMVAPAMHEYIKKTADEIGIEYDEGLVDEEAQKSSENIKASMSARNHYEKALKNKTKKKEPVEEKTVEKPIENEEPKRGLMARRS